MFREPVLLTYRRPSNSLFLRDKKYFAYFTKEINGNLMVFTSTEKKPLDGPFFLEDFYYPEDDSNSDVLISSNLTVDNFQEKIVFYDQYWLEHLEEQAYYCNLAKDALLKGNLKTLTEIFPRKMDVYGEYYYDPEKRPMNILGFFIDYFFTHDMDSEQVLASIIILLRELEIDPNKTFLEPDSKLMESICHLYLSRYWVPDEGMVAFILGALISEGADYQVYYKGKHFVMWVSESLTPQALKIINDMASELNLSYVVFEAEYATFKFLLPSKYLDQNLYFDPDKTGDFLADFKTAAPGSIEQVFARDFTQKSVRFVGDEEYDEWIEMLDSFAMCNFSSRDEECQEMVFAIQNGYHKKLKDILKNNRDLLFRNFESENAVVYALGTIHWYNKRIPQILSVLKEFGFDFDQKNRSHQSIVIHAALEGDYALVDSLLDYGVDIYTPSDGWTLLEALGVKNDFDLFLKVYRMMNLSPNQPLYRGRTLLHSACLGNNYLIIRFLLDEGYNPNTVGDGGATPLMVALITEKINYQAIETLLKSGLIDLSFRHMESMDTYLHTAVRTGRPYRVQLVLDYQKDVNLKNASGERPLDLLAQPLGMFEDAEEEEEFYQENLSDIYEIYWMLKERGATFAFKANEEKIKKVLDNFEFPLPKKAERIFSIVEVLMEETEKAVQFEVPEGMKLKIGDRVRVPLFNNGERNGVVVSEVRPMRRSDIKMRINQLKKVIAKLDN